MATPSISLASSQSGEFTEEVELMAGDTPHISDRDVAITVVTTPIPAFTPLARNATTQAFEPWANGGTLAIAAISLYPMPVGAQRAAVRESGMFNLDAINWPAGTTEAQVQAASRETCRFRKLLYSNKRTGNEGAPGTPAGP